MTTRKEFKRKTPLIKGRISGAEILLMSREVRQNEPYHRLMRKANGKMNLFSVSKSWDELTHWRKVLFLFDVLARIFDH